METPPPAQPDNTESSGPVAADASGLAETPERIGPYRILGVLGEGGMGTVYLAEQKEPVRRRVALKVIKLGMSSKDVLARFDAERQALAMMEHDNIAKVLEAGTTETGQPYFVMEHVAGLPLTEHCDKHRLNTKERLKLFQEVCAGVQHAHQKGVIHRDLKPSNILVRQQQERAVPKIIDFGIARATDHRLVEATIFTEEGRLLGTPAYMSPEQAEMSSQDIDTRTDIYSLGVILYQLLVGDLPFRPDELRKAGLLEIQRRIREDEPPRPSTRLTTRGADSEHVARQRRTTSGVLARELRGDLDWIVMMAMEKDRARRYGTANELAADIARHLGHEPVVAGRPGVWYRLRKFERKYRGQLVAAELVFVALAIGLVAFVIENRRANDKATEARVAQHEAEQSLQRFNVLRFRVDVDDAIEEADGIYPAWPDNKPRLEAWLSERGEPLLEALGFVTEMAPRWEGETADIATDEEGDTAFREQVDQGTRRFMASAVEKLREDLAAFAHPEDGVHERVLRRLRWAEQVGVLATRHEADWQAARRAVARADGVVASALYAEHPIDLVPQTGLVPIGMNPVTKLWEFYHLRSAWDPGSGVDPAAIPIPGHDPETGHIAVGDDTGVVLVLLPGGTFTMGAQSSDPDAANHDPLASSNNEPVHEVTLAPFFLGRHELTQGQWSRLSGEDNPSYFKPGNFAESLSHPVEQVEWSRSDLVMQRHRLLLPTEAQWEYGCRAGTTTPWWTGVERDSLVRDGIAANLADQAAARIGATWPDIKDWPELDDGWGVHAPVDVLRPNPWGLFHVHGNVWEWCRDRYGSYEIPCRPGDGLRMVDAEATSERVSRSGSFSITARLARSSHRSNLMFEMRSRRLGLRVSRALD